MRTYGLLVLLLYFVQSSAIDHDDDIPISQKLKEYFLSPEFQLSSTDAKLQVVSQLSKVINTAREDILKSSGKNDVFCQAILSKNTTRYVIDPVILKPHIQGPANISIGVGVNGMDLDVDEGETYPANCMEILTSGQKECGIYTIKPSISAKPFQVLCDMKTLGGGWTHIHKRVDGRTNFERSWREYKFGFGYLDAEHEFWMGLKNIYALTGDEARELLVEITDRDGLTAYALYKNFAIGKEQDSYPLTILSGYSGDAGDSLSLHLGMKFSTPDFDNTNCSAHFKSGWWFHNCFSANLNGKFTNIDLPNQYQNMGIHWRDFKSLEYCHAKAKMLVRPVQL